VETRILDSDLPLEENFYENGENIYQSRKELSFMTINFYNVPCETQEFILAILKKFDFKVHTELKLSDKVSMVSINL